MEPATAGILIVHTELPHFAGMGIIHPQSLGEDGEIDIAIAIVGYGIDKTIVEVYLLL